VKTHDEDRIGRIVPTAGMPGEEIGSAQLALLRQLRCHGVGAVPGLRPFQRIAAFIMRETVGVVGTIFQRLAQRERQVDAVHEGKVWPPGLFAHAHDFIVGEAIGLEVRQCVPRIAMVGLGSNGGLIAGHRVILRPGGLERVALAGERRRIAG